MAWITVADTRIRYANVLLQYDDSSSGTSRSSRVIARTGSNDSIYIYLDNFTVNGSNQGRKTLNMSPNQEVTLWTGSLPNGNRTVSWYCPWGDGGINYSITGYIPTGVVAPSGLSISLLSKTYNSGTFRVSLSSYGVPSNDANRYIEAGILPSSATSYGSPYKYKHSAKGATSADITISQTSYTGGDLTIQGNTLYKYGAWATNVSANTNTGVAGSFYTPCPPLSALSLSSQSYRTYNTVNAVMSYTRQSDGGAQTRTGYYRYSTNNGQSWSSWTSFGTVSNTSGTFTAVLPTSSTCLVQALLQTPNGGNSDTKQTSVTTNTTHTAPVFSDFDYEDTNSATLALTGDDQVLIQGQSTPYILITQSNQAVGNDGVAVTGYTATLTGASGTIAYSSSSDTDTTLSPPTQDGEQSLTVTATDALNLQTSVAKQVNIIPWSAPTLTATAKRANNFEANTTLSIKGTYSELLVNNIVKNTITVSYRTREQGQSAWGNWITKVATVTGSTWEVQDFVATFASDKSFDVQVQAEDQFASTTVSLVVQVGSPEFYIGEDGRVSIGKLPTVSMPSGNNGQLEVDGDVHASNIKASTDVYINGTSLLNAIYPVGSIFMSVNSTNPGTYLGGTWERIYNRFLVGGGNTYSVGSSGGAEKHYHWTSFGDTDGTGKSYQATSRVSDPNTQNGFTGRSFTGSAHQISESSWGNYTYNQHSTYSASNLPPYLAVYMWKRTA